MKLSVLHEYWVPIAGHPGKLGELDTRAKKQKRISILKYPEDRERWSKWAAGQRRRLGGRRSIT